jgi:hypothetical protein
MISREITMSKESLRQEINAYIQYVRLIFNYRFLNPLERLRYRIWNASILLWWYRLWIREDEFHRSLDMDLLAMRAMNKKQKERYLEDLSRRRRIAHERDLNEE